MPERLSFDHPPARMLRANIARSGDAHRPYLRVPDNMAAANGDFIRLHLGSIVYRARSSADVSGLVIRGVYDNKYLARAPNDDENRLVEWCREHDRADGDAVGLDELGDGYQYGPWVPDVRQVYRITERSNDSLSSIAEQFGPFGE